MFQMFNRVTQVISVIFLSFILGAVLAGVTAFEWPQAFERVIDTAGNLKSWLSDDWLPLEYNNIFRILFKEESLVLMFFTILARLVLYTLFGFFNMITKSFRTPTLSRGEVKDLIAKNKQLKNALEDERRARAAAESSRVASAPPPPLQGNGGAAGSGLQSLG